MIRRVLLLFGAQLATGAALLANNLIVAHFLGPAGKGKIALSVFVPMATVVFVSLGFHLSASYFVSRQEYPAGEVFSAIFALSLILSVALALIAVVFLGPIRRVVYNDLPLSVVLISLLSLPPLLVLFYSDTTWIAMERAGTCVVVRLCQSAVYLAMTLILVGMLGKGVIGGIAAFTVGAYAAAILSSVLAVRAAAGRIRFASSLLKRGLRFGLAAHAGSIADYSLYRIDTFVISKFAGFEQLGYYSIAGALAEVVWYLTAAVRPVLFARTAKVESREANVVTPVVLRGVLVAGALFAAGLFAAGWLIIRAWLPAFRPALPVLAILLLATEIALVFQLTLADLTSRGRGSLASKIAITVLPVGVGLYLVLIPRFGIMGAGIASLLAYSLQSVLALIWFRRVTGVGPAQMLVARRGDLKLAMHWFRRQCERFSSGGL